MFRPHRTSQNLMHIIPSVLNMFLPQTDTFSEFSFYSVDIPSSLHVLLAFLLSSAVNCGIPQAWVPGTSEHLPHLEVPSRVVGVCSPYSGFSLWVLLCYFHMPPWHLPLNVSSHWMFPIGCILKFKIQIEPMIFFPNLSSSCFSKPTTQFLIPDI